MSETYATLNNFREFLINSWENMDFSCRNSFGCDVYSDFLQANWEILVESRLVMYDDCLLFYGEGADCNGGSSRVTFPDRKPNKAIYCNIPMSLPVFDYKSKKTLRDSNLEFVFDRFMHLNDDGFLVESPPFDLVICNYFEKQFAFKFTQIRYKVENYNE